MEWQSGQQTLGDGCMTAQIANTIGLVANMVGVALVFFYGFPQPSHNEGVGLGLEEGTPLPDGRTVAEYNRDVAAQRDRYLFRSKAGLSLMAIGFTLQLCGTWLPTN